MLFVVLRCSVSLLLMVLIIVRTLVMMDMLRSVWLIGVHTLDDGNKFIHDIFVYLS